MSSLIESADYLRGAGVGAGEPRIALILGSGFGAIEEKLQGRASADYRDIPGFPAPAGTAGHLCRVSSGMLWGVNALVFRGRYHAYEGRAPRELAVCTAVAQALGVRTMILTNAAGGIRDDLQPDTLMAIRDHINLLGINPLAGLERLPGAAPFPSMGRAYDPVLRDALVQAGDAAGERVHTGVYAAVLGPSFETPAEVEYLRRIGADAVGMSTTPEAITAVALGMRVAGLSLITNRAGSTDDTHERVLKAGSDNAPRIARVLEAFVARLQQEDG
jgi:purine-nucleoside phosphorylase